MDRKTIKIYDEQSLKYADGWISQPPPVEIHRRVEAHFKKGLSTADIGAGSGRDTAWLNRKGYPTVGFDASRGLLQEARRRFPGLDFREETLPDLKGLLDASFDQILCETVLMHLPETDHAAAFMHLLRILKSGGVLLMSWRTPESSPDRRDGDGRLYAEVDFEILKKLAATGIVEIVEHQQVVSPSSGKRIEEVVLRKK